ncbi:MULTISPECIES: hypothetical protein [unclassified Streptomyces]|uniref:hypothetical protein n=1 Tax=unclassified Streptomyces TaxID=2593676 RepID=UPI0002EFBCF1|nr:MULTISPECIES: hypothetical protein [unclassified Streptomyces]
MPDAWWDDLCQALGLLSEADGVRVTVRDEWMERAFPQFLGIPAPAKVERVSGHGDLHWGNLTTMPLNLLDWERWGLVSLGFDAGLLHANSLKAKAKTLHLDVGNHCWFSDPGKAL